MLGIDKGSEIILFGVDSDIFAHDLEEISRYQNSAK